MPTSIIITLILILFALLHPTLISASSSAAAAASLRFNYRSLETTGSPNPTKLLLQGSAARNGSTIWLTPDTRISTAATGKVGRLLYAQPLLPLIKSGANATSKAAAFSFATHFTFQIITTPADYGAAADGLAFFISSSRSIPSHSAGGTLGLSSQDGSSSSSSSKPPFFAVEFDTFQNSYDPSASHIAVDVNTVEIPVNLTDTSDSSSWYYLYSGYVFRAWIEYDSAKNHRLNVYLANCIKDKRACTSGSSDKYYRPATLSPILTAAYDLSTVFVDGKPLYFGLSAATGSLVDGVAVFSWGLDTRLLQ